MTATRQVFRTLLAYARAQAVNAVIVLLLYIVLCAVAGVQWWFAVGLLCGLANAVPVIGSILALGIALLAKWDMSANWIPLAWIAGGWLLIQLIDGLVLSPRAAGHAGVNPLLSIPITLVAGLIFGPIGVLLAIPVVAAIAIVLRVRRSAP